MYCYLGRCISTNKRANTSVPSPVITHSGVNIFKNNPEILIYLSICNVYLQCTTSSQRWTHAGLLSLSPGITKWIRANKIWLWDKKSCFGPRRSSFKRWMNSALKTQLEMESTSQCSSLKHCIVCWKKALSDSSEGVSYSSLHRGWWLTVLTSPACSLCSVCVVATTLCKCCVCVLKWNPRHNKVCCAANFKLEQLYLCFGGGSQVAEFCIVHTLCKISWLSSGKRWTVAHSRKQT